MGVVAFGIGFLCGIALARIGRHFAKRRKPRRNMP